MGFASKTPLAWRSFTHNRMKFVSSVGGVAFAVVLMFLEMGFLNGLFDCNTRAVEVLDADLVLVNVDKVAMIPALPFERRHLHEARSIPGVATVVPVRLDEMRSMFKDLGSRRNHPMLVYGCDPDDPPFRLPGLREEAKRLKMLDTALVDSESKKFYGDLSPGTEIELVDRRLRVVGSYALGPDFRADGSALVSERTFVDLYSRPGASVAEQVEFGLIRIEPGSDRDHIQEALREKMPETVSVLTLDELSDRVRHFWGQSKPIGFVFGLGLTVGFFIGMTICYQILYVDISDNLPQYATLKAMGYDNRYLLGVVITQAMYLAAMGFAAGVVVSRVAYAALEYATQVPMFFTTARVGSVLVLTFIMCLASGFIAIGKVQELDPAELF